MWPVVPLDRFLYASLRVSILLSLQGQQISVLHQRLPGQHLLFLALWQLDLLANETGPHEGYYNPKKLHYAIQRNFIFVSNRQHRPTLTKLLSCGGGLVENHRSDEEVKMAEDDQRWRGWRTTVVLLNQLVSLKLPDLVGVVLNLLECEATWDDKERTNWLKVRAGSGENNVLERKLT